MNLKKAKKNELGLRGALPFLSVFFLMIFIFLPLPFFANLVPHLTLIGVYYWSVFRPELMPISLIFVIGVLQDILSGGPLGMTALLLILVGLLVTLQGRKFLERDFMFNWLIFSFVSVSYGLSAWILASLYHKMPSAMLESLGQVILTIAIFPPLYWMLGGIRKRLW